MHTFPLVSSHKLELTLSKTKVIIFNKTGKFQRETFYCGNQYVECVKTYKYLGIEFCNSGSFTLAQTSLKTKAMKACFKLKKIVESNSLSPKVAISLFNSLIKPIILYGSEIWGTTLCAQTLNKTFAKCDDMIGEKVLLSFEKYILGAHRNTTNLAVRGELGIFPIGLAAIKSVFKFKNHVHNAPQNTLLELCNVQGKGRGTNPPIRQVSWWIKVSSQEDLLDVDQNVHLLIQEYEKLYKEYWSKLTNISDKLRTYSIFKQHFCYEKYLDIIRDANHRKALIYFRTSSHSLAIETGRHCTPKVPVNKRLCKVCKEVENEEHFLLHCTLYSPERKELFGEILKTCKHFPHMNDEQKLYYLMTAEGVSIKETAKFCHLAFTKRNQTLYPPT